jgi:hypothetical protein
MAARILLFRSGNLCSRHFNFLNLMSSLRPYAQQTAVKIQNIEKKFPTNVWSSDLHIKEVKFIGSEKLRNSSAQEIEKNPQLLKELSEAYKMMSEDDEEIEATKFCTNLMLTRRGQE